MRQFQVPLYSLGTKGQWIIRFDTALANKLELGPLRMTDLTVPEELVERIKAVLPKGLPPEVVCELIAYYAANKPEDSDWVVLPVANFDVYFGTTSFGRKYLRLIPEEILERPDSGFGVCRYRIREEYRICGKAAPLWETSPDIAIEGIEIAYSSQYFRIPTL